MAHHVFVIDARLVSDPVEMVKFGAVVEFKLQRVRVSFCGPGARVAGHACGYRISVVQRITNFAQCFFGKRDSLRNRHCCLLSIIPDDSSHAS